MAKSPATKSNLVLPEAQNMQLRMDGGLQGTNNQVESRSARPEVAQAYAGQDYLVSHQQN